MAKVQKWKIEFSVEGVKTQAILIFKCDIFDISFYNARLLRLLMNKATGFEEIATRVKKNVCRGHCCRSWCFCLSLFFKKSNHSIMNFVHIVWSGMGLIFHPLRWPFGLVGL